MILSDYVSINANVARSVNIERDMGDDTNLRQYYLTGKGLVGLVINRTLRNGEIIFCQLSPCTLWTER
jgi:flagella basal body P-ring formation protein FlgA